MAAAKSSLRCSKLATLTCKFCGDSIELSDSFRGWDYTSDLKASFPNSNVELSDRLEAKPSFTPETNPCSDNVTALSCQVSSNSEFLFVENFKGTQLEDKIRTSENEVKMFEHLSENSSFEHPMCQDCADVLIKELDDELTELKEDSANYQKEIEKLKSQKYSEEKLAELMKTLKRLQNIEAVEQAKLDKVQTEYDEVMEECKKLQEEIEQLQSMEISAINEKTALREKIIQYLEDKRIVENEIKYAKFQLNKLEKTNIFNAAFQISHDEHFAVINGFRLGSLPDKKVDWLEINTALGQVALLMSSMAKRINLTFKRYTIVPFGNHSYIQELNETTSKVSTLPLYNSGRRLIWNSKFDLALIALLDCFQQFANAVHRIDSSFNFPYAVNKDKLESTPGSSYSIRFHGNKLEQWTRAMKYFLTDLKWAIAWLSAHFQD